MAKPPNDLELRAFLLGHSLRCRFTPSLIDARAIGAHAGVQQACAGGRLPAGESPAQSKRGSAGAETLRSSLVRQPFGARVGCVPCRRSDTHRGAHWSRPGVLRLGNFVRTVRGCARSQHEETSAVTMGVRAAVTSARTAPIDGPDI